MSKIHQRKSKIDVLAERIANIKFKDSIVIEGDGEFLVKTFTSARYKRQCEIKRRAKIHDVDELILQETVNRILEAKEDKNRKKLRQIDEYNP